MAKKIRCAVYDRVSTDMQAKEGLSLAAQKQALTDYATSHGYEIVGYYADEGITARKKMQNRKDLIRLLNDVKADKIDLILVTKLDRWFRNIKDYHNTQAILEAHNCNWKTIFEQYDTTTANGRFAINIMLSVNENECDRTSDRIHSIFDYKKSRKEHLNGAPAYGYIADENKCLIKNPETRGIVEDIFSHYFTVFSKTETVEYIMEKYAGHPKAPTMYQVVRILKSETYTGKKYGIDDYCEAYITKDQYRKIREISDSKIIPRQIDPFLFSSMIKCPICGRNMSGLVKRQHLKSGGVSAYKRYRCGSRYTEFHNGACISESVVEKYLMDNVFYVLQEEIVKLHHQKKENPQIDRTVSLKNEMNRLNILFQKGRITEEYYEEQYTRIADKLQEYEAPKTVTIEDYQPVINALADGWEDIYQELNAAHKKSFWKSLLKEIYVDKESRRLCGFKFRL